MTSEEIILTMAKAMVAADSGPEGSYLFTVHWGEFGETYIEQAKIGFDAAREHIERHAFFTGFKRSDFPAPPDEKIEAAFQWWQSQRGA
jgi:hypothetical protein